MMPDASAGAREADSTRNGTILAGTSETVDAVRGPLHGRRKDVAALQCVPDAGEVQPDSADAVRHERRDRCRTHAVARPARGLPGSRKTGRTFTPAERQTAEPSTGLDWWCPKAIFSSFTIRLRWGERRSASRSRRQETWKRCRSEVRPGGLPPAIRSAAGTWRLRTWKRTHQIQSRPQTRVADARP